MALSQSPTTEFGSLALLPPELRFMIYEHTVTNGSAPALMRTSKAINSEIKPRLYDTIDIHLYPRKLDPWARISFPLLPETSWTIEQEEDFDTRRRGVSALPYTRFNRTRVVIYAPDTKIIGQLAYLWIKTDAFAHVLCDQKTLKGCKIAIEFRDYRGHTWTTNAQRRLEAQKASYLRYAPLENSKSKTTPAGRVLPNPFIYPTPSPRWATDFFWIPLCRMYLRTTKDTQNATVILSDGSAHNMLNLIEGIQMWLSVSMVRSNHKGPEAQELYRRVTAWRTIEHIFKGGPPPWESFAIAEKLYGDTVRKPEKFLPGVVRELLGIDKSEEEEE
ncbi:uncharacterized protein BDV14DRAFT_144983 [Aspergillus stella-maris]|uniref:uncharacterized protein n=1 Tax=Aspergillus stella-maris TaxID=1810926 RepID=UPI003CCD2593